MEAVSSPLFSGAMGLSYFSGSQSVVLEGVPGLNVSIASKSFN